MIHYYYNEKGENVPRSEATIERIYAPAANGLLKHIEDRRLRGQESIALIQYEMCFTNEYLEEIVQDLSEAMHINADNEIIQRAWQERNMESPNNLLLLGGEDEFICIDCSDRDWIFPLIVRCLEEHADQVRTIMQRWDDSIRREYGQKLTDAMQNVYGKEHTALDYLEEHYQVKIEDMFRIRQYEDKPLRILKFSTDDMKRKILRFEVKHDISLPRLYQEFLQKNNGGNTPHTVIVYQEKILGSLAGFNGIGDVPRSFADSHVERFLEKGLLPIASDILGNDIAIGLGDKNRGRIFFCNHQMGDSPECEWEDLKAFLSCCHSEAMD